MLRKSNLAQRVFSGFLSVQKINTAAILIRAAKWCTWSCEEDLALCHVLLLGGVSIKPLPSFYPVSVGLLCCFLSYDLKVLTVLGISSLSFPMEKTNTWLFSSFQQWKPPVLHGLLKNLKIFASPSFFGIF